MIKCEVKIDDVISAHVKGQCRFELHVESFGSVLRHRWRPIKYILARVLQKHNLVEIFPMHASCKTIFCLYVEVINITFPSLVFANNADKHELAASVRFSWLNFSSEIRLYLTYFQNCFKISAAIISTISSFIFTHIQPIRMQTCSFYKINSQ